MNNNNLEEINEKNEDNHEISAKNSEEHTAETIPKEKKTKSIRNYIKLNKARRDPFEKTIDDALKMLGDIKGSDKVK